MQGGFGDTVTRPYAANKGAGAMSRRRLFPRATGPRKPAVARTRRARRGIAILAAALAGSLAVIASASSQAPSPPPLVQASIEESKKTCDEKSTLLPGFQVTKDVNGDGRDDYILDYGQFRCGESSTWFCGTGGCLTQVFASLPDGTYVKVLDENVRQIRFAVVNKRPAMLLDLHGSACGKVGAAPCPRTLFWNGRGFGRRENRRR